MKNRGIGTFETSRSAENFSTVKMAFGSASDSGLLTNELIAPNDSDEGQFNKSLNMSSHQRLLEIEEKRKKRKIRKAQPHFRGSSFGQGNQPKSAVELIKAYEYGPNGFTLEESGDNTFIHKNQVQNISSFKNQVNCAIIGDSKMYSPRMNKPNQFNKNKELLRSISQVSNEDLLVYINIIMN